MISQWTPDTTTWLLVTLRSAKKPYFKTKMVPDAQDYTKQLHVTVLLNDFHSWNLPHTHTVWVQVSNSTLSDDNTTPPLINLWKCCTFISLCHHLRQGKHSDPTPASKVHKTISQHAMHYTKSSAFCQTTQPVTRTSHPENKLMTTFITHVCHNLTWQ